MDLSLLNRLSLEGQQALFVGSLWAPLNREAPQWYVENVHARLDDVAGYELVAAGNARNQATEWLEALAAPYRNISLHFKVKDLD